MCIQSECLNNSMARSVRVSCSALRTSASDRSAAVLDCISPSEVHQPAVAPTNEEQDFWCCSYHPIYLRIISITAPIDLLSLCHIREDHHTTDTRCSCMSFWRSTEWLTDSQMHCWSVSWSLCRVVGGLWKLKASQTRYNLCGGGGRTAAEEISARRVVLYKM